MFDAAAKNFFGKGRGESPNAVQAEYYGLEFLEHWGKYIVPKCGSIEFAILPGSPDGKC